MFQYSVLFYRSHFKTVSLTLRTRNLNFKTVAAHDSNVLHIITAAQKKLKSKTKQQMSINS